MLRDLTEICSTAYELDCAVQAEIAAYEIVKTDEKLKPLFPELYAYLVRAQVWANNTGRAKGVFRGQQGPI